MLLSMVVGVPPPLLLILIVVAHQPVAVTLVLGRALLDAA
jgi:hypothetical protein